MSNITRMSEQVEDEATFVDGECAYHGPVSGTLDPAGDPPESCPACSYEDAMELAFEASRGN